MRDNEGREKKCKFVRKACHVMIEFWYIEGGLIIIDSEVLIA